jgi:hypothetical protein
MEGILDDAIYKSRLTYCISSLYLSIESQVAIVWLSGGQD